MDMGVEPFLLSSSLAGVLSQRLVRKLCVECRSPCSADQTELEFLGATSATVYKPSGCEICQHTGYRGRTGIYELVTIDDHMRQLIHDRCSEQELTAYARTFSSGLREDGKEKILEGVTTVQEVLRVTLEE